MQDPDPNNSYKFTLATWPRGRQERQPITNSCNRPFKTVEIDMFTNCNLCVCTGWLPRPVGKITDFSRLEDIWDNPRAHEIQSDVTDKKFTWCAVEHCGIKHHNNYESTYQIVFAIDDSLRRNIILHNQVRIKTVQVKRYNPIIFAWCRLFHIRALILLIL